MPETPFAYWKPGSEERQLRIFISHRHGDDATLYDGVVSALKTNGFPVQDVSLSASQVMAGPRGGALPKLQVMSEIAARIYTSDVLIAPSRPATSWSEWVTWEVQLASIGYGIPILFVNEPGLKLKTQLVTDIANLALPHRVCDPNIRAIASSVAELVNARPIRGMRCEEIDDTLEFRGPPKTALDQVLKKLPFTPRLGAI